MMSQDDLRDDQLSQFSIIERVNSVFSLLGSVFIIATFCSSKMFHKPINRLVFFASFGNMMTNVGTLMARSYVNDVDSPGCQFQAFLIQMFLPADTLWTLAMAVNVYLTFYHKFDAAKLRKMEIPYLLVCYGVPFAVALTYIFISSPSRGRMYGDATLWCWIAPKWDIWRIATFYGPIWVIILITFFIYIRAGGEIYRKHKQLRNFHSSTRSHHDPEALPIDDPLIASKTTEVRITSEAAPGAIDLAPLGSRGSMSPPMPSVSAPAYSVQITASHVNIMTIEPAPPTMTTSISAGGARPVTMVQQRRAAKHNHQEATNAAWSYTKCALLFFTAMLVTWIPSSANRVYSVVHTGQVNLTLEYMSAFVLPLQGFWNAVIYVVTSWKACKLVFHDLFLSRRPVTELVDYRPRSQVVPLPGNTGAAADRKMSVSTAGGGGLSPRSDKYGESESMTDLASRPSSQDPGQERNPRTGI